MVDSTVNEDDYTILKHDPVADKDLLFPMLNQ